MFTVGDASLNKAFTEIAETDMAAGEQIGIPVAIIILIVVLGALVAAGLPIVIGLISVFVAIGMAAVVGRFLDLSFYVVNIIGMIGLAVGIDYSLFVISRFREERRKGHAKLPAIEIAGGTANKAVLYSGVTVVVALTGMLIAPGTVFRSLGIGAVLVVIVAILATLMLMPAILSLLGDKLDWPRKPHYAATEADAAGDGETQTSGAGFWGAITHLVMARPIVSMLLAGGLLIAMAIPFLDAEYGSAGVSSLPAGTDARAAYELLQRDFAAGTVAPVEIVVSGEIASPALTAEIDHLIAMLIADGAFGPVATTFNATGDLALISAPLNATPDSAVALDAIQRLRNEIVPMSFGTGSAEVFVTGQTAYVVDFNEVTARYTPLVFAFVLGLSFLLLMVAFRSVVVPAKAILMNLLSVGAAYGAIVLVFQKGVGADLFGFQQVEAIENWLPLFLFCVLFGLSMDYHVFLLSRIKEHYNLTKRNGEAVAVGLQSTAKLITGAALIMVAVFSGFAAGSLVSMQQVGFGLAVAILLDATVVRSVLVPSTMALLGDRNWYFPRWLEWLPRFDVEGGPQPAPAAPAPRRAPAPVLGTAMTSGDD
jgi:putative drug exporter of the RND superfamily